MKSFLRVFVGACFCVASLARAGVPIDISLEEYQAFVNTLDAQIKKLPFDFEGARVGGGVMTLASGTQWELKELETMAALSSDDVVDYLRDKHKLKVIVVCSPRKDYEQTLKRQPCEAHAKHPDFVAHPIRNAAYLSRYSAVNKGTVPLVYVLNDSPHYALLEAYVRHLQTEKVPPVLRAYSLRALRVAAFDTLSDKGPGADAQEKATIEKILLIQRLQDDLEGVELMLRLRDKFRLSYVDIDELYRKALLSLAGCESPACKSRREFLKKLSGGILDEQVALAMPSAELLELKHEWLNARLVKVSPDQSFQGLLSTLKDDYFKEYNMQRWREEMKTLLVKLQDNPESVAHKERPATYERLFRWMALNAQLQYQLALRVWQQAKGKAEQSAWANEARQLAESLAKLLQRSPYYGKQIPKLPESK